LIKKSIVLNNPSRLKTDCNSFIVKPGSLLKQNTSIILFVLVFLGAIEQTRYFTGIPFRPVRYPHQQIPGTQKNKFN